MHVSYKQCLPDQWQCLMQGNQLVASYITKFDEFLVRYDENESDTVILSIFCSGLSEDLRREFFVRDISTLEQFFSLSRI